MHWVANRRRDGEVDLGSKSEAGYQEQCRQALCEVSRLGDGA
jgi:hypothetical protein